MTYDEKLAARVRRTLPPSDRVVEKHMFGGIAFLLDGKMFCGVTDRNLMVRVGPDAYEAALARPHARPMDFTGRPLTGFVFVGPSGSRTDTAVAAWVRQASAFVSALPVKKKKPGSGSSVRLAGEAGGERDRTERLVAVEGAGERVAQPELAAEAVDRRAGRRAEHAAMGGELRMTPAARSSEVTLGSVAELRRGRPADQSALHRWASPASASVRRSS